MSRIKGIEQLKGKGIKARILDEGKLYTTYREFAEAVGYPSAIKYEWRPGKKRAIYDVLAKGKHEYDDIMLYVVENERGERFIVGEDGLSITGGNNKEESTINNLNEMTYGELTDHARIVLDELRTKAYAEGYKQGKFDQRMDAAFKDVKEVVEEKTQQERRDEIVERAKADIGHVTKQVKSITSNSIRFEFIVNKKKRTIVCLVRGRFTGRVYERGIAKCAPNDCFNIHIGKAIALRRALGLEVPDDYINAPQPTEVREGDVIKMKYEGFDEDEDDDSVYYTRIVKEFDGERVRYESLGWDFIEVVDEKAEILDDSRDE